MDFFERQDKTRAASVRLTVLFSISVFLTFLTVHVLIVSVCAFFLPSESSVPVVQGEADSGGSEVYVDPQSAFIDRNVLNPAFLFIDFLIVGGLVLGSAAARFSKLKSAGVEGVAVALGGVPVLRGVTEARSRRLYNVVEEIAIASGTPTPRVFILEGVKSVNACAVGTSPSDAAVCVTRGALDILTRDELQGVVAHEFSHILNNDVRLNMRLIGMLFGLEVLTIVAIWMMRSVLEEYRLFFLAVVGLILFCIGAIGLFFANIIRAAISRQREYLADASAVQYTRNPLGIAGALKKIGCAKVGSVIASSSCEQASHMFFSSVFRPGFFQNLYRTHPPIAKRVKVIDPTFDGVFPTDVDVPDLEIASLGVEAGEVAVFAVDPTATTPEKPSLSTPDSSTQGRHNLDASTTEFKGPSAACPSSLYGDWARKDEAHSEIRIAPSLLEPVPPAVDRFLVDAPRARAVFYAVLFSHDASVRARQLALVNRVENQETLRLLEEITPSIRSLSDPARLLAVRLATPLIKSLTLDQYKLFRNIVVEFCAADGRLDFFEYTLQMVALRELDLFFRLSPPLRTKYHDFALIEGRFKTVLVALAYEGEEQAGVAGKAFHDGCAVLGYSTDFPKARDYTLKSFTDALLDLAYSSPQLKKLILQACWRCILHDGAVTERESALLSVVAAALGAPAPIWRDWK